MGLLLSLKTCGPRGLLFNNLTSILDSMPPKKIGRYIIKAELGRGGMATVYRAYDPSFEREVAVKVLPQELLHDSQFKGRFAREGKIIARLEHAAIVPVYDVGEENGQPYFVMRYMTGGSLADRMKNGPLPMGEIARIFERLGNALNYAHTKGIVHRDLKPGNILFDDAGDPYISDFGIAKLAQAQATTSLTGSSIIGTPTYMSPEQAQGEEIDGRSDIYSLGVILYELWSGRLPYESNTPLGLAFKHVTEPIPHILDTNPKLPVAAEAVIEKAMAKNAHDRFQRAVDLSDAVTAVAQGKTPDLERTVEAQERHPEAEATKISGAGRAKSGISSKALLGILAGVLVLAALVWTGSRLILPASPAIKSTATSTSSSSVSVQASSVPSQAATTSTSAPATVAAQPAATKPPAPPAVGGADKIAMVSGNNIWVMDMDGSHPQQLTQDSKAKSDLQWLPDGQSLAYVQDQCAYRISLDTKGPTQLACFDAPKTTLNGFQVSPDGHQVAINLNSQLFIVAFDPNILAQLHGIRDFMPLGPNNLCLAYHTVLSRHAVWSADSQKLALLVIVTLNGHTAEAIRVLDVHNCHNSDPLVLDEFPGKHFTPENYTDTYTLPSYTWDGIDRFLFNTFKRNEGYGALYVYNETKNAAEKLNPINGTCCYRDARWSPDGKYIIFAFQDLLQGANARTQVYYIPFGSIQGGGPFKPLNLPLNFLTNPREAPEFALRPVHPSPPGQN